MFLTAPSTLPLRAHPSPFLHGPRPQFSFPQTSTHLPSSSQTPSILTVHAMKKMQGRVVCAASDKTVAVEVVRLAPHPKYKRRIRKKKKYQAHDPDNQFQLGDFVQLEKCRPISKTKTFIAVAVASRNSSKPVEPVPDAGTLDLPLESQQPE